MKPRIIGDHPLAKDQAGRLKSRIGSVFPDRNVIVTLPGIHATQRLAYLDLLSRERQAAGEAPLEREEQAREWNACVDLIMDDDTVLIRPDPANMALAFEADEVLQELLPKHKIRFLYAMNENVRNAIKRRGECWRISPVPKSLAEMRQLIGASKIGIGGREIYYYNRVTGVRWLTCAEFAALAELDDAALARHLAEIREYSARENRHGGHEVEFFAAEAGFSAADFSAWEFCALGPAQLRTAHAELRQKFSEAVDADFRADDPACDAWRSRMVSALIVPEDATVSEETLQRLSSEFFMQIQWLPGGRIEDRELIFDPLFEAQSEPGLERLCDEKCRGIIYNFVREDGDLEYVNVGRVIGSLSRGRPLDGRRDVYIAVVKLRGAPDELVHIIRMQKWGIREHLDAGKELLEAICRSEEYTEYIQDRRLGCRQLGMNLPSRVTFRRLMGKYDGKQARFHGTTIWAPYFQRDYIRGIASDKIPLHRFGDEAFALRFAQLLGWAAAVNVIVGRRDMVGNVLFDDGDEVVIEDSAGMPAEIVVADHTGTFADYLSELADFAAGYAAPINRRVEYVSHPEQFADAYLEAFQERCVAVQQEYHRQRRAFDSLFTHQLCDTAGNFAYRWKRVLQRLDETDPQELTQRIREKLSVPECAGPRQP